MRAKFDIPEQSSENGNANTPETNAVWTRFREGCTNLETLEEVCQKLELERNRALNAGGFCEKHQPSGGVRNCVICGMIELTHALHEIDYALSEPNEMELTDYDLHYDEDEVVRKVKDLRTLSENAIQALAHSEAERDKEKQLRKSACKDWADDHSYLQKLCLEAGCDDLDVQGDSCGVPTISDLVDLLVTKLKK